MKAVKSLSVVLKKVLDEYLEAVCKHQYERLEYENFKKIASIANNYCDTTILFGYPENSRTIKEVAIQYNNTKGNRILIRSEYAPFIDFCWDNYYNQERKESDTMKFPAMNLDFGPAKNVAYSPYGLAIKSGDKWLTYDTANEKTVDVTGFIVEMKNMIYKMPVAIKDIKAGDIINHQSKAMFVTRVEETKLTVIDLTASEEKVVIPVSNVFGFNFITKVVSLMNLNIGTPSPDQPFGNLMPIMMLSALSDNEGEDGDFFGNMDMSKMMMLSMMTGNQNPFANLFNFNLQN